MPWVGGRFICQELPLGEGADFGVKPPGGKPAGGPGERAGARQATAGSSPQARPPDYQGLPPAPQGLPRAGTGRMFSSTSAPALQSWGSNELTGTREAMKLLWQGDALAPALDVPRPEATGRQDTCGSATAAPEGCSRNRSGCGQWGNHGVFSHRAQAGCCQGCFCGPGAQWLHPPSWTCEVGVLQEGGAGVSTTPAAAPATYQSEPALLSLF